LPANVATTFTCGSSSAASACSAFKLSIQPVQMLDPIRHRTRKREFVESAKLDTAKLMHQSQYISFAQQHACRVMVTR
jgi:hypothetical protein